ncbi:MAG: DUF4202 domain-containing protein [Alphaproteobacteria bacterium]
MTDRFAQAIAEFDAQNAQDPNRDPQSGRPKELVYAEQMTRWLEKLAPSASETLRLAVRAQHIKRWKIPRSHYPMNRIGYLKWRTDLKNFHAALAGAILGELGYGEGTIARVQALLRKERLKQDSEAQTLEDVICLVFLENYFADFAKQHDAEKIVDILRKTWKKMSENGQKAALGLAMPPEAGALVKKALSPS